MTASSDQALADIYAEYFKCFFAGDVESLHRYVSDNVTRNGKNQGLEAYRQLSATVSKEPDLHASIRKQIVGTNTMSVQIVFEGTPRYIFLGLEPTGNPVEFEETIIYEFEEGKIAHVWSTIDTGAVREQLIEGTKRARYL